MNHLTTTAARFLLACAYAAQYWIYKSHLELKKLNEKVGRLLAELPRRA